MRVIEERLAELRRAIQKMGRLAEQAVERSLRAFASRDRETALAVIRGDTMIDEEENRVDELAFQVLATCQPVADDLRLVVGTMHVNSNLERIADQAVNIAERAIDLADLPPFDWAAPLLESLQRTGKRVRALLGETLDHYARADVAKARTIFAKDDEVDDAVRETFLEVLHLIAVDPNRARAALDLLSVAKSLERVSDLTMNIAEEIIFAVEGHLVRHVHEQGRETE